MAIVRIRHQVDERAIATLFLSDKIANNMFVRGLRVESQAKVELSYNPRRVDTGRLRSSVHTSRITRNGRRGARIGTNVNYALFIHNGTGIYGPLHRPIRPRRAKVLRFRPRGETEYVFARSVKGIRPNRFLVKALRAARLP